MSNQKMNRAVHGAVDDVVYRAVDWDVYWAVDDAVSGAVFWDVGWGGYRAVWGTVNGALAADSAHPALLDFLSEVGETC